MKMHLVIINIDDRITFRFWGRAIGVQKNQSYRLTKNAVRAAKHLAGRLNIEISSCVYEEPLNKYSCKLKI